MKGGFLAIHPRRWSRHRRLYPLTKMRAKPALPLAGKYRLIDISDQQTASILGVNKMLCADPVQQRLPQPAPHPRPTTSRPASARVLSRCFAASRRRSPSLVRER